MAISYRPSNERDSNSLGFPLVIFRTAKKESEAGK